MQSVDSPSAPSVHLSPLEIACGYPLDEFSETPSLPLVPRDLTPRGALEEALLPALLRPPCLVSFSGGRDSSAVLAVAVDVASREGLPLPIPMSMRFPDAPDSAEDWWQERVIRHLGLSDWERLELHDELDFVGPLARTALSRHGLLWPPGSHMIVPMTERARNGSLLTGIDGDGILGGWRWVWLGDLLKRRRRPSRREVMTGLRVARPGWTRFRQASIQPFGLRWLRPEAQQAHARARRRERQSDLWRWDRHLALHAARRSWKLAQASCDALARTDGTSVVQPLLDPRFASTLAVAGGRLGLGDRTALMHTLVGDLLPDDVLERPTKADGLGIYWTSHSRKFAAEWKGGGIDTSLVDEEALRSEWARPEPHAATAPLLQSVWLSAHQRGK